MTQRDALVARLAKYCDPPLAAELVEELIRAAVAEVTLDLIEELEELSPKVARAAADALPELRKRVGMVDAVQWLDLGVTIAGSSGATAMKFFKESPLVLGLIEPALSRRKVLVLALELAEGDPNVALEFFRKAPELLSVLPVEELAEWAEIGLELSKINYVVGIEFFQQCPSVAAVLPLDQVGSWVRFGMKLITQNSLGKTDYVGTLEFFRTSPTILGDIQGPAVRTLVVSLGDQLAEREPHTAITVLAESPALLRRMPSQDWSRRILQYGLLVAERDPQAALEYVRRCPEIVTLFDEVTAVAKFEEWFKGGMEVLEYSPEGARAYYALETKKALASVEHAMSGVPLRQVARSLKLFVQGLCGVDVSIESLPESKQPSDAGGTGLARATVSQDGRTIALPAILRRYATPQQNIRLYTVMAAHEAGHLEFGTYNLSLTQLTDLLTTRRARHATAESSDVRTLTDFFGLYPQPGLIRDLWTVLEDARVEYLLQHEYPGLRSDLAALAQEAVATRSLLHGMSAREMVIDALLLLTTAGRDAIRIPEPIADVVEQVWTLAQTVLRSDATAEDVLWVADRIYVALEAMPKSGNFWTEEQQEQSSDVGAGPSASEHVTAEYRPVTNWAYRGDMNPDLIKQSSSFDDDHKMPGADAEAGVSPPIPSRVASAPVDRSGKEAGLPDSGARTETPNQDMVLSAVPDSVAAQLLMVRDDRRGRHEDVGSTERIFLYDEWDGTIQDYRSRWCRLVEQRAPEGTNDFADAVLAEHGPLVRMIRRYFESIRPPGLRRVHGQADGEDIDLDAVIRRKADQAAGTEPSDRVYIRRERRERDVAVAFLMDLSGSTSRQIEPQGRRVIDVEKEGLIVLSEALEALGDQYAVYGYSGRGRRQVDFLILKDFEESHRARSFSRIGAVTPLHQNRDGAAIRHTVQKLLARRAKVRLLVLLSDGRPLDDGYADEYSLEDTKMALRESRKSGVEPFCITVDTEADNYLRRMYGDVRYLVIDRTASLPERLPRVYQRLTA